MLQHRFLPKVRASLSTLCLYQTFRKKKVRPVPVPKRNDRELAGRDGQDLSRACSREGLVGMIASFQGITNTNVPTEPNKGE